MKGKKMITIETMEFCIPKDVSVYSPNYDVTSDKNTIAYWTRKEAERNYPNMIIHKLVTITSVIVKMINTYVVHDEISFENTQSKIIIEPNELKKFDIFIS